MPDAETYRRHAETWEARASGQSDPLLRDNCLKVASAYRRLGETVGNLQARGLETAAVVKRLARRASGLSHRAGGPAEASDTDEVRLTPR